MNAQGLLTCSLCGHRFAAAGHAACKSCPLQMGCEVVCCPACGYQTVDPRKSLFGRLAQTLFNASRPRRGAHRRGRPGRAGGGLEIHASRPCRGAHQSGRLGLTLADVPPGWQAKIGRFLEGIPPEKRVQLLSYGLVPNLWVCVVQHSPVTVVRLDNTELALEMELAGEIQVLSIREGLEDENSQ